MDESKLLQKDKDEWFYQSLKKYKNLYMFELEFPVDAIEVICSTSICIAGTQAFSKRCELLQLSIPPKLLPKDIEEGLCKDRDFKIESGGYASGKIIQIKSVSQEYIATVQQGKPDLTLFKLGGESSALLKEYDTLVPPKDDLKTPSLINGVIDTAKDQIVQALGNHLYLWEMGNTQKPLINHSLAEDLGKIAKVKFWDENIISLCTRKGRILLLDTRDGQISHSQIVTSSRTPAQELSYSFDSVSPLNRVWLVDSCGAVESFDLRKSSERSNRATLPELDNVQHLFEGKLNIEVGPFLNSSEIEFLVSGFKLETVPVYKEDATGSISTLFVHDGHSKPVTHAIWHRTSPNLCLSSDIDSILHAWQFENSNTSTN